MPPKLLRTEPARCAGIQVGVSSCGRAAGPGAAAGTGDLSRCPPGRSGAMLCPVRRPPATPSANSEIRSNVINGERVGGDASFRGPLAPRDPWVGKLAAGEMPLSPSPPEAAGEALGGCGRFHGRGQTAEPVLPLVALSGSLLMSRWRVRDPPPRLSHLAAKAWVGSGQTPGRETRRDLSWTCRFAEQGTGALRGSPGRDRPEGSIAGSAPRSQGHCGAPGTSPARSCRLFFTSKKKGPEETPKRLRIVSCPASREGSGAARPGSSQETSSQGLGQLLRGGPRPEPPGRPPSASERGRRSGSFPHPL